MEPEDIKYEKFWCEEDIKIGDVISLVPISNTVTRSKNKLREKDEMIIGICSKVDRKYVYVKMKGIIDVNVTGIVCIGDKLSSSDIPGLAKAIKYERIEEKTFNIASIGKVIGLYKTYDKVKVLLDIE